MLLPRKQVPLPVVVEISNNGGVAWRGIERWEEGEGWTAMSGYEGVGATRCSAGLIRAGRDIGRGTVEVSLCTG